MDGKFLKMKLQIIFSTICAIIISLIFIPMMRYQNYEKLSWNGYYSYQMKSFHHDYYVILEKLDNYPTIIPLFLWGGLVLIILGHYFFNSQKSTNYSLSWNRHGKRANSFGGWLISIGSCIGISGLLISASLLQKIKPDNSSMKLTYGFYILLIAYIINLIPSIQSILLTIKSIELNKNYQILLIEFEENSEKEFIKLHIDEMLHSSVIIKKIIESYIISGFYVGIPYSFFLIFIQLFDEFEWFNDVAFYKSFFVIYFIAFGFITLNQFVKNRSVLLEKINQNYKEIFTTALIAFIFLGSGALTILGIYGLCDGFLDWFTTFGEEDVYLSNAFFYIIYYIFVYISFLIKWLIILIPSLIAIILIALTGIISRLILKDRYKALLASFGSCSILNLIIFLLGRPLHRGFPFKMELPKHVFIIIIIAELITYPLICLIYYDKKKSRFIIFKKIESVYFKDAKYKNLSRFAYNDSHKKISINQQQKSYTGINSYIDRKNRIEFKLSFKYPNLNRKDISFIDFLIEGENFVDFYWIKKITNLSDEILTQILVDVLEYDISNGKITPRNKEDFHYYKNW